MINNTDLNKSQKILADVFKHNISMDFGIAAALGAYSNVSTLLKFGRNTNVGTTIEDVYSPGGLYEWPQVATNIEVVSDNAGDTFLGLGARTVLVQGLDEDWNEITEEFEMNGVTPAVSTNKFLRVNRAMVDTCGTYSNNTLVNSHLGTILVQDQGGSGTVHIEIGIDDGLGVGQSTVSRFSLPEGKVGVVRSISRSVDGNKEATLYMNIRENNVDISSPPYKSKRTVEYFDGITGPGQLLIIGGPTIISRQDMWISASAAAAGTKIEATFEMFLFDGLV